MIARYPTNIAAAVRMDPRLLGVGTHAIQAVAIYAGKEAVRSEPLVVQFVRTNQMPLIKRFAWGPAEGTRRCLTVEADDAEKDQVFATWQQDLFTVASDRELFRFPAGSAALANWDDQTLTIDNPGVQPAPGMYASTSTNGLTRLTVDTYLVAGADHEKHPAAGLAFNIRPNGDFDFFGWFWNSSSWSFGRCESGQVQRVVARGAPCATNCWASLAIYAPPGGGLQAEVDGRVVARWPDGRWNDGGFGIFAGQGSSRFKRLRVSPTRRAGLQETTGGLLMDTATESLSGISLRLSDGRSASETPAALPAAGDQ